MLQTPDTIQISEILKRLKRSDPTLTEIAMNNYKDVESVLIDIARLLKKNTYVTKLSVANTQMKPAVCLVSRRFTMLYLATLTCPSHQKQDLCKCAICRY